MPTQLNLGNLSDEIGGSHSLCNLDPNLDWVKHTFATMNHRGGPDTLRVNLSCSK